MKILTIVMVIFFTGVSTASADQEKLVNDVSAEAELVTGSFKAAIASALSELTRKGYELSEPVEAHYSRPVFLGRQIYIVRFRAVFVRKDERIEVLGEAYPQEDSTRDWSRSSSRLSQFRMLGTSSYPKTDMFLLNALDGIHKVPEH